MRSNIGNKEWSACLASLRDARALILRDAESFHEAATTLEQIGRVLSGEIRDGLKRYKSEILGLANSMGELEQVEKSERLFNTVCDARNMAVHEGAWARHLSSRLIDLFLILEESIMSKMSRVEDVMVRDALVAEPWHMVADVRKMMLSNSFSCLPIFLDEKWLIIRDVAIIGFLRGTKDKKTEHRKLLSMQICSAIETKGVVALLGTCCGLQTTLFDVAAEIGDGPMLVTEEKGGRAQLLGIVTPFDLL